MLTDFYTTIQKNEAVSLAELDAVALLDRIDSKFVLNQDNLKRIMPCLLEHYLILEIDAIRVFSYENNYFDTPDFLFYKAHHNGANNRVKVRSRRYVESNLNFFEIKRKEKVNRTKKFRQKTTSLLANLEENHLELVANVSRKPITKLDLILTNNFKRATFVNHQFTERVTIDTQLVFSNSEQQFQLENLAVVEIKQSKSTQSSALMAFLKQNNIRKQSISKYIFGAIGLFPTLKKNNFLRLLKQINKISN